jgi:hypothetical protein
VDTPGASRIKLVASSPNFPQSTSTTSPSAAARLPKVAKIAVTNAAGLVPDLRRSLPARFMTASASAICSRGFMAAKHEMEFRRLQIVKSHNITIVCVSIDAFYSEMHVLYAEPMCREMSNRFRSTVMVPDYLRPSPNKYSDKPLVSISLKMYEGMTIAQLTTCRWHIKKENKEN